MEKLPEWIKQAADGFWNDNRVYHDSDGVDAAQCFKAGAIAVLERANILVNALVNISEENCVPLSDWADDALSLWRSQNGNGG